MLLAIFIVLEGRFAKAPLMPLRLFRSRQLSAANAIIGLVGASTFAMWFFLSLYLQDVLGYSAIKTGLVFLPMTLAIVVGSTIASKVTMRFGPKRLLVCGMAALAIGLAWLSDIGVHADYLGELLAPGLLTSFAMPFAFVPAVICATTGVKPQEAGLASAVANSARLMGGALGLAVLATIATSHSNALLHDHTGAVHTANQALVSGFQVAFWFAGGIAAVGMLVALFGMPSARREAAVQAQGAVVTEM